MCDVAGMDGSGSSRLPLGVRAAVGKGKGQWLVLVAMGHRGRGEPSLGRAARETIIQTLELPTGIGSGVFISRKKEEVGSKPRGVRNAP